MIRLDAATVLLQWAVGGMAFCWFTTRRREVGLGYGWLLRGCYGLIALGGAVVGFRYGTVPVREAAAIGVVAGCAARARRIGPAPGRWRQRVGRPNTIAGPSASRR